MFKLKKKITGMTTLADLPVYLDPAKVIILQNLMIMSRKTAVARESFYSSGKGENSRFGVSEFFFKRYQFKRPKIKLHFFRRRILVAALTLLYTVLFYYDIK